MIRQHERIKRVSRTGGRETNIGVWVGIVHFGSKFFMAGQQVIQNMWTYEAWY